MAKSIKLSRNKYVRGTDIFTMVDDADYERVKNFKLFNCSG
jgi:hypothetical protein